MQVSDVLTIELFERSNMLTGGGGFYLTAHPNGHKLVDISVIYENALYPTRVASMHKLAEGIEGAEVLNIAETELPQEIIDFAQSDKAVDLAMGHTGLLAHTAARVGMAEILSFRRVNTGGIALPEIANRMEAEAPDGAHENVLEIRVGINHRTSQGQKTEIVGIVSTLLSGFTINVQGLTYSDDEKAQRKTKFTEFLNDRVDGFLEKLYTSKPLTIPGDRKSNSAFPNL